MTWNRYSRIITGIGIPSSQSSKPLPMVRFPRAVLTEAARVRAEKAGRAVARTPASQRAPDGRGSVQAKAPLPLRRGKSGMRARRAILRGVFFRADCLIFELVRPI